MQVPGRRRAYISSCCEENVDRGSRKDYHEGKGEVTYYIALEEKIKQLKEERLKHKDSSNGEFISLDELADIYREAVEDVRAKLNLSVRTRGKNGDVEDYLETRRPFSNNESRI